MNVTSSPVRPEHGRAGSDHSAAGVAALAAGWDRQDPLTLRFLDPELERAYLDAFTSVSRRRLRAFLFLGSVVWVAAALLGPIVLGVSALWISLAAVVAIVEAIVAGVAAGRVGLRGQWLLAALSGCVSAVAVVALTFEPGTPAFASGITAMAIMACCIFPIGLVRIAGWVAAGTVAFQVGLFLARAVSLGLPGTAVYQGFLLAGTMGVAALASRYLEGAERNGFAQGQVVADLHRRIDRLFRQYLSPDVAEALVNDPRRADLGGEVVEVSVLFADLSGYTPFSERSTPTEVVAALNDCFGGAVPAVFAEGGTIVQFVGDALMAIFNAPLRQPDHAVRACRAALALQRLTKALPGSDRRPGFRVAVNTGPALVGNIGSSELRNFSALGDTTNVAARLQTYAAEGAVVIGERTYELVRTFAEIRPLGAVALKGKSVPTRLYELVAIRDIVAEPNTHQLFLPP
jgi:class 3 adenylate cyclase